MKRLFRYVAYLALLALTYFMEHPPDLFRSSVTCSAREEVTSSTEASEYRLLTSAGYRAPTSRFVRIVALNGNTDPPEVMGNVCSQRLYLSKVLASMARLPIAMVVIDKSYSDSACPAGDIGTRQLVSVLRDFKVAVIIGLNSQLLTTDKTKTSPQPRESCLVITKHLDFGNKVKLGLIRLNRDTRKIPLEWKTYLSPEELDKGKATAWPTLSLVAAQQWDPAIATRGAMKFLLAHGTHPYASFIPEDATMPLSAASFVCKDISQLANWRSCPAPTDRPTDVDHKIVLIGEISDKDQHASVVGREMVPGVVLQANYIEALLDDRYFKPVPQKFVLAFFVIWAFIFDRIWEAKHQNWKQVLLALLKASALLALAWAIMYWILLQWRYFLEFWVLGASLSAVVVKLISSTATRVKPHPSANESPTQPSSHGEKSL